MQTLFTTAGDLARAERLEHDSVVLVLPYIDEEQARRLEPVLARRALHDGLLVLVHDTERLGFMAVANLVFARSESPYVGYLAQDAYPGEGWLRCGLSALEKSGADLLPFSDGRFHGNLAVFGLVRRSFVRGLYRNCLFYPGYRRHFGDTELSAIALGTGRMIYHPGCLLVEVDYDKHVRPIEPADEALYRERAATGFGGLVDPFEPK